MCFGTVTRHMSRIAAASPQKRPAGRLVPPSRSGLEDDDAEGRQGWEPGMGIVGLPPSDQAVKGSKPAIPRSGRGKARPSRGQRAIRESAMASLVGLDRGTENVIRSDIPSQ